MAKGTATQEFVPIERVRDGVIVLKTGELRAILITNSLNLGLKSEDEQTAILSQFQNIKPYMELLQERSKLVKEDLLKIQIHEYMGFISKFTEESNIMTKHFFITIPYYNQGAQTINPSSLLSFSSDARPKNVQDSFETSRIQLDQRIATVMQGLSRFGLRGQKLGTEEVVELFYKLFNPSEGERAAPKMDNK
jgi:hypothetical protein